MVLDSIDALHTLPGVTHPLTAHVAEPSIAPRESRLALAPQLFCGLGRQGGSLHLMRRGWDWEDGSSSAIYIEVRCMSGSSIEQQQQIRR